MVLKCNPNAKEYTIKTITDLIKNYKKLSDYSSYKLTDTTIIGDLERVRHLVKRI